MNNFQASLLAWRSKRAFAQQRLSFLEDMGEVLVAGQSGIQQRLKSLATRNQGKRIEHAYYAIYQELNKGKTLGESLRPFFNDKEFQLIRSYDHGDDIQRGKGFLTVVAILGPMDELAQGAIRLLLSMAISAALVLAMWIGIAGGFAHDMEQIQPRKSWPWISTAVIGSGEFLSNHPFPVSLGCIGLLALLIWALPNWTGAGRRWCDRHFPGFGIYKEYRSVLTLVALSSLLSARSGLQWSFDRLAEQSNRWESRYIYEMRSLSASQSGVGMLDVGYFSDRLIDRIMMREGSGTLEDTLNYVAVKNAGKLALALKMRLELASKAANTTAMLAGGIVMIAVLLINLSAMQKMAH